MRAQAVILKSETYNFHRRKPCRFAIEAARETRAAFFVPSVDLAKFIIKKNRAD